MSFLHWLLGHPSHENLPQFDGMEVQWESVRNLALPLFLFLIAASSLTFWYYVRLESRGTNIQRGLLGALRLLLLLAIITSLFNPVLRWKKTSVRQPTLAIVIDGSESMSFADRYSQEASSKLETALAIDSVVDRPRIELLQSWLANGGLQKLKELEKRGFNVSLFQTSGTTSSIESLPALDQAEADAVPTLRADTKLTALGDALRAIQRRLRHAHKPQVVLISDFRSNTGIPPAGSDRSPAEKMGMPVTCVGIGAKPGPDVQVTLSTDPVVKRNESAEVKLEVLLSRMEPRPVKVSLRASWDDDAENSISIFEGSLELTSSVTEVRKSFTPNRSGRLLLSADVQSLPDESLTTNNKASRALTVIDDFLRLAYVAHEPTWEWRFIKEVFQRDERVGMDGFRTFLGSSDPRVREANPLFLSHLAATRASFFANDVIFLGDIPRQAVTQRFAMLLKEYVGNLGGGLVIISGPRYGPAALQGTEIEDMLPVMLLEQSQIVDEGEFAMKRTPAAKLFPFMQLAADPDKNEKVWSNMNSLSWFQPVRAAQPDQATVLAVHPTQKLEDGVTPSPLIVHRRYGKGQVVFIAFNEMWRLRKRYGETYYTRFWSKLIYELGMSHALGNAKRFVVELEDRLYQVDESISLRVEAFDANYERLDTAKLEDGVIHGYVTRRDGNSLGTEQRLLLTPTLLNVFETNFIARQPGRYEVHLVDPVTNQSVTRTIDVSDINAERRNPTRDQRLQQTIAQVTNGTALELEELSSYLASLEPETESESNDLHQPLWSVPGWYLLLLGLVTSEWIGRRRIFLT